MDYSFTQGTTHLTKKQTSFLGNHKFTNEMPIWYWETTRLIKKNTSIIWWSYQFSQETTQISKKNKTHLTKKQTSYLENHLFN